MNIWPGNIVYSFDTETTSADPLTCSLLTATMAKLTNNVYEASRSWILNPGVEVPEESTAIHGLTTEYIVEHGMDAAKGLEQIVYTVAQVLKSGNTLVVYNAAFDLTLLEAECQRHGIPGLRDRLEPEHWHRLIDPFVLVQAYETFHTIEGRWGKKYTLPEVCRRFGIDFVESHDAELDAVGAGQLTNVLGSINLIASKTPAELFEAQRGWRTRLQDSLRAAFDKKNFEHDGVDGGWPLHSTLGDVVA